MSKKNRGFTLIEMLATIAIIAVVTLIATVTYNKVRKDIINREYKNLKTLIETAAVKYSAKTGYTTYFVQKLIDEGLVEPDDDDKVYDPRDDKPLNCHIIQVTSDDNSNYTAELGDVSYDTDSGCNTSKIDTYASDLDLVAKITKTEIDYLKTANDGVITDGIDNIYSRINIITTQGSKWTNKQLDITANLTIGNNAIGYRSSIDGARYIWNKNTDTTTIEPNRSYTTNVYDYYNGYFYVDVYTKSDEHYQSKFLYKYDKQKPVIYANKTKYANPADEDVWAKSKQLLVYATDKDGVGLDRVYAGIRPCTDLLKNKNLGQKAIANSTVHVVTVNDVEAGKKGENGEINICAVDKLGNLSETSKFVVKKIDITPPHCGNVEGDHDQYQWEERTVKQYCYDDNIINGKSVIGSQCTQDPFPKSWSSTTKVGTITIKDKVGWTTDCNVNVYVDRTAPNCSTVHNAGSTSSWTQTTRTVTQDCQDDHVGCKQPSFSRSWDLSGTNDSIKTDIIEIKDRVPRCSQTSETGYCVNYETIKDTTDNLDSKNNARNCTVGVYIDHKKPTGDLSRDSGCNGTSTKSTCIDPDSGVATNGGSTHTFNSAGSHDISINCTDKVGNSSTVHLTYTTRNCGSGGAGSGGCANFTGLDGKTCKVCFPTTCYSYASCEAGQWNYEDGTRCAKIVASYTNESFGCGKFSDTTVNDFDISVRDYSSSAADNHIYIYKKYCDSSGCKDSSKYYAYKINDIDTDTNTASGVRRECTEFANYFGLQKPNIPNSSCLYWKCED